MPWSGSSNAQFTRSNGVNTGSSTWAQDKAAGTKITTDRHDTHDQDLAAGINATLKKDGTNAATGNLNLGGNRYTNAATGTARSDLSTVGQVQDGAANFVAGGGTADAITATYSPAITALVDGMTLYVRATDANATTTPTFAPNGLTAYTIVKNGSDALVAGDIVGAGHVLVLQYELANTRWQLLNPLNDPGFTVSAFGASLIDDADAAAARTTLELGDAATGTIGSEVQAYNADTLFADESDNLTVGFTSDVYAIGNSGTGTVTVSLTEECLQTLTINGSFTLAPPSSGNGVAVIIATTDATGSYTITTSGFTIVNGAYDNTADKVHRFVVTKVGSTTILDIDEVS